MNYKYLYKSKVNGIKIRTDQKLDPNKYELIHEIKSGIMRSNEIITK